jgi:hypothetical protein
MQPGLDAALAVVRLRIAARSGRWDEALRQSDIVLEDCRRAGLQFQQSGAISLRNSLRLARRRPDDLEAVMADALRWRSIAAASDPQAAALLDGQAAEARFWLDGVAVAHAELLRAWQAEGGPRDSGPQEIRGDVVDASGHPIAGASVAAAIPHGTR